MKRLITQNFKFLIILFCFGFLSKTNAQFSDLVRLEYSFIPKSDSQDRYTRYRLAINYPHKISEKNSGYLFVGTEVNRVILNLRDDYPFDTERFRTINVIDFKLGYSFRMKNPEWRVGILAAPRLASTLNAKITSDDFLMNGLVLFTRSRTRKKGYDKPSTLILGVAYSATFGLPIPIPIIRYSREITKKWSYGVGIPSANLTYTFNDKNNLRAFVNFDGYFANIQEPLTINGENVDSISLSVAVLGLGYEHNFTKHLIYYINSGYTLRMNNILRDSNRDEVFNLDNVNAFYLRTGLKFQL